MRFSRAGGGRELTAHLPCQWLILMILIIEILTELSFLIVNADRNRCVDSLLVLCSAVEFLKCSKSPPVPYPQSPSIHLVLPLWS
jgi:hypothetical protein